jgi:UDP-N-acetylmuramate dehydrogenase
MKATLPALDGFDVAYEVPAATLTTWRVGGPIAALVRVHDDGELRRLSLRLDEHTPVVVVGRGSNLLVADRGFAGVAVMLIDELERVDVERPDTASAGGGAALPVLARRAAAAGRTGLEFYVGIPGSVGGAVRMNAGGHGCDTAEVLGTAQVLRLGTDAVEARGATALGLRFRGSDLSRRDVVVAAGFRVTPDDPATCQERIDDVVRWRREHQPGGPNAGSVFVNPQPQSAGELIDRCGMKGRRVGGAVVSQKHANFIQAEVGATAADIVELIEVVRAEVLARCGVAMASEVQMIGFGEGDAADVVHEEDRA